MNILVYILHIGQIREILQPLLDTAPPDVMQGKIMEKMRTLASIKDLVKVGYKNREVLYLLIFLNIS